MGLTGLKKSLVKIKDANPKLPSKGMLSTGTTVLNLAISGRRNSAIPKGSFIFWVGDSDTGKSFNMMQLFAEANLNPAFDDYDFIFDDVEHGVLFNIADFFGAKTAARIKEPKNGISSTTEQFYFNLDDYLKIAEAGGRKFIYVLDSETALETLDERKKFQERKKAIRGNKKAKGDFGMSKAKLNSTYIKGMVHRLEKTGCILIMIGQTRDNIDMYAPEKSTVSGGKSLKFYAHCQLWSKRVKKLTKKINDKERQIGVLVRATTRKNRIGGKQWDCDFSIFWSAGIDNLGASVDFLVAEGHWKKKSGKGIDAKELGLYGWREDLIAQIEQNNQEDELSKVVYKVWKDIEAKCIVQRKKRYE